MLFIQVRSAASGTWPTFGPKLSSHTSKRNSTNSNTGRVATQTPINRRYARLTAIEAHLLAGSSKDPVVRGTPRWRWVSVAPPLHPHPEFAAGRIHPCAEGRGGVSAHFWGGFRSIRVFMCIQCVFTKYFTNTCIAHVLHMYFSGHSVFSVGNVLYAYLMCIEVYLCVLHRLSKIHIGYT